MTTSKLRLKSEGLVALDRPFAIFVEPGDTNEDWFAKIVGFELDQIVYAPTAQLALVEAIDLLNALTGKCSAAFPGHDFAIQTTLDEHPAWECSRCGEVAAEDALEIVDE